MVGYNTIAIREDGARSGSDPIALMVPYSIDRYPLGAALLRAYAGAGKR